ncbi:MAG: DUF4230 domain-containing protein [Prevotella sp.]|nr:DUF4230 domain-containing protein [Prevotella sp.]
MKKSLLLCVILIATLLAGCKDETVTTAEQQDGVDTIPMMIMQIRKCAKLYTAEYQVHKIITHDDQMSLQGTFLQQKFDIKLPMSSRKIAIPVDATLKAYIDFSDFTEKNIVQRDNKIEIILPDPKVELTESRIDHNEIKRYVSLMRSNFTDAELTDYEKQGRAAILNSVPKLGIIDMAMESAAHTLIPLIKQMGYEEEDITITFRKKFTTNDLPILLDSNTIENAGE